MASFVGRREPMMAWVMSLTITIVHLITGLNTKAIIIIKSSISLQKPLRRNNSFRRSMTTKRMRKTGDRNKKSGKGLQLGPQNNGTRKIKSSINKFLWPSLVSVSDLVSWRIFLSF